MFWKKKPSEPSAMAKDLITILETEFARGIVHRAPDVYHVGNIAIWLKRDRWDLSLPAFPLSDRPFIINAVYRAMIRKETERK